MTGVQTCALPIYCLRQDPLRLGPQELGAQPGSTRRTQEPGRDLRDLQLSGDGVNDEALCGVLIERLAERVAVDAEK